MCQICHIWLFFFFLQDLSHLRQHNLSLHLTLLMYTTIIQEQHLYPHHQNYLKVRRFRQKKLTRHLRHHQSSFIQRHSPHPIQPQRRTQKMTHLTAVVLIGQHLPADQLLHMLVVTLQLLCHLKIWHVNPKPLMKAGMVQNILL